MNYTIYLIFIMKKGVPKLYQITYVFLKNQAIGNEQFVDIFILCKRWELCSIYELNEYVGPLTSKKQFLVVF